MKHLIIAGNGMVAHRLVEALRARDTAGAWRVTVIGEEPRTAYDRVALSSYMSGRDANALALAAPDFFDGHRYTARVSELVTAVDRATRGVTTSAGDTLHYDALVLATGSRPFVPPTPGHDLPSCYVYRTLEDLDAIRGHAESARTAVVVGGGLLGLEAAGALRELGLAVAVVEVAPRLMPVQVDDGGGEVLRRHIERLGVAVHCGAPASAIEAGFVHVGDKRLDADLVVFSAGIRPRDELARAAGLDTAERGGVAVDTTCRTSDEHIYAIGECAALDGRLYGLVAPGYAMAEVVADQLLGGAAEMAEPDTATKLKLLGVDVASFGDAHGATDGALDVVYADPVSGVYKKLVLSDDASTLLGAVLVGDASAYPGLRPLVGRPLPSTPDQLLLPASTGAPLALPGDAQVCTCNAVTKDDIVRAVAAENLTDVAGIKTCTRAGTSCGSCVPLLKSILTECGVHVSTALCEHFPMSRAELFELVRSSPIRTFSELIAAHGTGAGCDICKPAVASILASLGTGHILDGEQASLQDTNDHALANLQKDGTYSIVPRIPGGEITPDKLIVIGEVARDFGLYTKITGGQRIDLFGARLDQLPAVWRRLVDAGFESGHAYGKALRTVKSCVGDTWCRFGVQDSVGMAIALELRYRGLRAPHKIKSAVSGCARECAEARSKDFGVIATENGWNLYLGGNGGFTPRHADLFATDLSDSELLTYIDRYLMFYIRTADRLQRTSKWLESLQGGLDYLRGVIVDDSLGICAELDDAMARHVATYSDEWADALNDPVKLARFVPFINAPDATDPSILTVPERGQIRPARPDERTLIAGPNLEVVTR